MPASINKKLIPVEALQTIHGIELPIGIKFRQLIVTGPPGSGKTNLINLLHGWPNEGYVDLTRNNWWRDQSLTYRPREVHLGLPFVGFNEALAVFDKEWLEKPNLPVLEEKRLKIPPSGQGVFQTDWRGRYIFEFLLPSPEMILSFRENRHAESYHPADEDVTLEIIQRQVATYAETALYLHRCKLQVYVRETYQHPPMRIVDTDNDLTPPVWAVKAPEPILSFDGLSKSMKSLFGGDDLNWVVPGEEPQELLGESRVAYDGKSLELKLGGKGLYFVPEIPFGVRRKRVQKNWIVYDPEDAAKGVYPFIRLKEGENVLVGRANDEYDAIFNFSKNVAKRHINIANETGDLIFTILDEDRETMISGLPNVGNETAIVGRPWQARERGISVDRLDTLKKIRDIYGSPIQILPPDEALLLLKDVNKLLQKEPYREKDSTGIAGGLLDLPNDKSTVIVGDLHAQINNLLKILSENHILECLEKDTVNLLILGDAVHSEVDNDLEKMDSSVLIMDIIFRLKLRFPKNVFYLRGNHDSFDHEISKKGVPQGMLLKKRLKALRGKDYLDEMETFYDLLPYVAKSDEFIACHAGPPSRQMSVEEIINLREHPKRAKELVTSRLKHPNKPGGYSKGDIKKLRKSLGAQKRTPIIVGHTPLSSHGSIWLNVGEIKGHHILYSANPMGPGIFLNVGKRLVSFEYPVEPLLELIENLE